MMSYPTGGHVSAAIESPNRKPLPFLLGPSVDETWDSDGGRPNDMVDPKMTARNEYIALQSELHQARAFAKHRRRI